MNKLARAALWYARHGWAVFPVHSVVDGVCSCGRTGCTGGNRGKHPRTKHGVKEATRDVRAVERWWRRWPDANIGIACGPASGVFVIDVDKKDDEDGEKTLAALEGKHGRLPQTVHQTTGSGGLQFFYRYPRNAKLGNSVRKLGKGLDTRSHGGYVIVPPSLHLSGSLYTWAIGPHEGPPSPLPEAWIERLKIKPYRPVPIDPTQYSRGTQEILINDQITKIIGTRPGARNDTLNKAAYTLAMKAREGRVQWREASDELYRAALAIGLNEREVQATLRSAAHAAMQVTL